MLNVLCMYGYAEKVYTLIKVKIASICIQIIKINTEKIILKMFIIEWNKSCIEWSLLD